MIFTERELEVLVVIRSGARTYPHIAELLEPAVSRHTAEMHVRNIAEKLREMDPVPAYAVEHPLLAAILHALQDAGS